MTSYLVHVPVTAQPGAVAGLDRAVFVKDRVHFLAFLFPVLWLLYHRAWLALLGYVVAAGALVFLETLAGFPDGAVAASQFVLSGALAVFASDVRSWTLSRRGFRFVDVVSAVDEDDAARRFCDRWLSAAAPALRPAPAGVARTGGASSYQPVVGLFPEAGRS